MKKSPAWLFLCAFLLSGLLMLAANLSACHTDLTGTLSADALEKAVFVRLNREAGEKSRLEIRYALEDAPTSLGILIENISSFSLFAQDRLLYSCRESDPVRAMYLIPIPDELIQEGEIALRLETPYIRKQTTLSLGAQPVLQRLVDFRRNVELVCISIQLFLILISLTLFFSKPSERYLLALCLLLLSSILLRLANSMAVSNIFTHRSNKFLLPALGLLPTFLEISLFFRLLHRRPMATGLFELRFIVLSMLFCCAVGFLFPDQYTVISLGLNACVGLLSFVLLLTHEPPAAPGIGVLTICFGVDLGMLIANQTLYLLPVVHALAHLSITTLSAMVFEIGACIFVLLRFSVKFADAERLGDELKIINAELDERAMRKAQELTRERNDRHRMMLNIFHDLRTPLYVASECAGFIDEGDSEEYLPLLKERLNFLNRLVEDLFLIAKMEDDDFLMVMDTVDLSDIFRRQCESTAINAEKAGIIFTYTWTPGLRVWGDPYRLEQVLQNLLSNALLYTPRGKQVAAKLSAQGPNALFCIRDEGSGISKEDLPNVFTRYYRVNRAKNSKSTGLGLSIANEIMRYHHGTLSVQSEVGQGTTFTGSLLLLT